MTNSYSRERAIYQDGSKTYIPWNDIIFLMEGGEGLYK
jgi:hypothetical protein